MYDDENQPMAMTADESTDLLAAVRNPRILRHMLGLPLQELVHDLLRARIEHNPAPDIYVENWVIGMITALQPMLTATVVEFFGLSDADRAQRWSALDQYDRDCVAEMEWRGEGAFDDRPDPICDAWVALNASMRTIIASEWAPLALDVVEKPEAMIRNVKAVEAFRLVLDLTRHGAPWLTRAEIDIVNIAQNAPARNNLLPLLRDLRRVLR